jgi:hypothetical protein
MQKALKYNALYYTARVTNYKIDIIFFKKIYKMTNTASSQIELEFKNFKACEDKKFFTQFNFFQTFQIIIQIFCTFIEIFINFKNLLISLSKEKKNRVHILNIFYILTFLLR